MNNPGSSFLKTSINTAGGDTFLSHHGKNKKMIDSIQRSFSPNHNYQDEDFEV